MEINENLKFSSDTPYPPVCAETQNLNYARAMLDNMGGRHSEISTISLYIYNNLIAGAHDDISFIFHKISIVEMHHLEIFGKLALQLGENPRLWTVSNRNRIYWTPRYNPYSNEIKQMLVNAINGEKTAVHKYEYQVSNIRDQNVTDNLKRIIEDEQLHISLLEALYHDYCD